MPEIPEINFTLTAGESISRPVDPTLSIEGMAADAKAVGDALDLKLDTYTELSALASAVAGTDEIPIGRGGAQAKVTAASLASGLTSLGVAANPALYDFTAASGVTIARNNSVIMGKYIFVSVLIQTSAAITGATTTLFTLPTGATAVRMADLSAQALNGTSQFSLVAVGGDSIIRSNFVGSVSMPADYYHVTGIVGLV